MNTLKRFVGNSFGEVVVGCIAIAWGFSQLVELTGSKFVG